MDEASSTKASSRRQRTARLTLSVRLGEVLMRRQEVLDASAFALLVASGIALHALWPSIEGRKTFSDVVVGAFITFLCAFAFMFLAAVSGRWKRGSLEVSAWFVWLVFGAIGFFVFGVIMIGKLNGGTIAAAVWTVVLSVAWSIGRRGHNSTRASKPNKKLHWTRWKDARQ